MNVKVSAFDLFGNRVEFEASGWPARILQHEVDHLNGVLYADKAESGSMTSTFLGLWMDEWKYVLGIGAIGVSAVGVFKSLSSH